MSGSRDGLTREFLADRDLRIFKMRQAGVPTNEIARRFSMTTSAVSSAIRRQLQKLNSEALMAYPEVLRMELERLDALQTSIWPLTQHRKVKMDDGTEVTVEPDMKAIQTALSIMDRRAKLLGMEQTNLNIQMDVNSTEQPIRATLAGATNTAAAVNAFDPEQEVKKLLEIMGTSGVLPEDTIAQLLGTSVEQLNPAPVPARDNSRGVGLGVIDVDVVEENDE
jgi:hypothetical protein